MIHKYIINNLTYYVFLQQTCYDSDPNRSFSAASTDLNLKSNPDLIIFSGDTLLPSNSIPAISPKISLIIKDGTAGAMKGLFRDLATALINSLFVICSGATAL